MQHKRSLAENQAADHITTDCLLYSFFRGTDGLIGLDEDTTSCSKKPARTFEGILKRSNEWFFCSLLSIEKR